MARPRRRQNDSSYGAFSKTATNAKTLWGNARHGFERCWSNSVQPKPPGRWFSMSWEKRRPNLTAEVKISSKTFHRLFDRELLVKAQERLRKYNYPGLSFSCLGEP
jgi:hypothetical protein